jgi:hypothetical protein
MTDLAERIRMRAYHLWEQAGRPQARSDEFWYQARHELTSDVADDDGAPAADLFRQAPEKPPAPPAATADAAPAPAAKPRKAKARTAAAPAAPRARSPKLHAEKPPA